MEDFFTPKNIIIIYNCTPNKKQQTHKNRRCWTRIISYGNDCQYCSLCRHQIELICLHFLLPVLQIGHVSGMS